MIVVSTLDSTAVAIATLARAAPGLGARARRLRPRACRLAVVPPGRRSASSDFLLPRFSDVPSTFWNERNAAPARCRMDHVQGGSRRLRTWLRGPRFSPRSSLARWRPLGHALMPYTIAANAVPIIAFAPITNAWFGTFSPLLEDHDRRRPVLLPGTRQLAAWSDLGSTRVASSSCARTRRSERLDRSAESGSRTRFRLSSPR